MKHLKHFTFLAVLFVAVLLISNVASTKIMALGPLSFDGGTILFPLSYIFGDILTEVYGYKQARKVIWMGVVANLLLAFTLVVVNYLPPAADWPNQEAFEMILGMTPRIVLASIVAYFVGEFANSYVLAKLKVKMKGKMLWVRTIGSTLVGQGFDTVLFVLIAFYGLMPNEVLMAIIVSNYLFKVGVEVLLTPATYEVVHYLKKAEGVDHYDKDTNFNPFKNA